MALYLCLSVSVRSRTITKMAEWIQLVLAWEPPPTYATLRKFGYFQNNGIFYWKSVPNSGLRKFFLHMKFANFNKAHRRLSFLVSPTMVGASWLFITRQSAVTFKFQHFDLLYNLFMQQLTRFQLTALCAVRQQRVCVCVCACVRACVRACEMHSVTWLCDDTVIVRILLWSVFWCMDDTLWLVARHGTTASVSCSLCNSHCDLCPTQGLCHFIVYCSYY